MAACFLLGISTPAAADDAADEALYVSRFSVMVRGGDVYDPMEAVPGAAVPVPFPLADPHTVDPGALQAARDYALREKSTAFIVWRHGRIESADYAGGATAATPLTSKSLAKPLTALVIGRAIAQGSVQSLDQPVADFIPEWRGGPKAGILVMTLARMVGVAMPAKAIFVPGINAVGRVNQVSSVAGVQTISDPARAGEYR